VPVVFEAMLDSMIGDEERGKEKKEKRNNYKEGIMMDSGWI